MLDYKFLFNYLQLWRSYAIKCDHPVCVSARTFWAWCELGGHT